MKVKEPPDDYIPVLKQPAVAGCSPPRAGQRLSQLCAHQPESDELGQQGHGGWCGSGRFNGKHLLKYIHRTEHLGGDGEKYLHAILNL